VRVFLKAGLGGAAALALVLTFALGRTVPPPVVAAAMPDEPGFVEIWNDSAASMALKNAEVAPRMIPLIKIEPTPAPVVLPTPVIKPNKSSEKSRPRERVVEERNICTKHHMRKVYRGRSWRCRR